MTIIRRLNCFDAPKIKKMIAYLGSNDKIMQDLTYEAARLVHEILPFRYKFLPESYILLEGKEILGLITVVPFYGNPYKINITRLIFKQNMYEIGKQLVEFVFARYGAKGVKSFHVSVDQSHDELLELFLNGCGFRQCSYENLWKIENFKPDSFGMFHFRSCQNSDAKSVARMYNSELNPLYKPSMCRIKNEFEEPLFAGMNNFYKNRYVLDDSVNGRIIAYLSITTSDNYNYIIDFSLNDAYNLDYDKIINFALSEISRRKSNYCVFLKHRQYTLNADIFEKYLHQKKLNCVQTQCVLVKDFYKQIKQPDNLLQIFQFGEISSIN